MFLTYYTSLRHKLSTLFSCNNHQYEIRNIGEKYSAPERERNRFYFFFTGIHISV